MAWQLYPKNRSAKLDPGLFKAPTAEYRGTPFWSWNCKLDAAQLLRQIEQMKEMGLGGFHMHARVGLATEYLGPEFMACVKACVEKARVEKMLAWLYDEDRWPSGAAGGLVTRDPRYRRRQLRFTPRPDEGPDATERRRVLLARYSVKLRDGRLASYRRLKEGEKAAGTVWHAYLECPAPSPWFNNQTYLDTLSRAAVEKFIEATHECYRREVGADFGGVAPAIFTDEPNLPGQQSFGRADEARDLNIAWTDDFSETFGAVYGEDPLDTLPEVFWELPGGKKSRARYRFHDHAAERFASAFCDTIGKWCGEHNLAFTGHLLSEESLSSQVAVLGEAMRGYRAFQLPGIDILCDRFEFTTAKQAASAARQYGRPGVLSELYGVTNWDFPFVGHKRQGDWQAALGVTVRVQHLAWVSMAGEAKRDYPAAIGYQSPWYREYPLVEDHFARLNVALTRGRPITRVGVIHPVESFWLCYGPQEQTRVEREERNAAFANLLDWLLYGLVDFDFICESLLPSQSPVRKQGKLKVGECAYEAVIVPGLRTIRAGTLDRLEAFARAGGTVIFAGEVPSLVDAEPSPRARKLANRCLCAPWSRAALLEALEPWRDVGVQDRNGGPAAHLLYQLRQDGALRTLFICNTSLQEAQREARVVLKGRWNLTELDTFTGEVRPLPAGIEGRNTVLQRDLEAAGHLLLQMKPAAAVRSASALTAAPAARWTEKLQLAGPVPMTLAEPNSLLLDQAEYRLDDGEWRPREELLRADSAARKAFGYPQTGGGMAQPWTETNLKTEHRVSWRFQVVCEASVAAPKLVLENAAACSLRLDGRAIPSQVDGWWVDEALHTVPLPDLSPGRHTLEVSMPYGRRSVVEWSYLLGDFGVIAAGREACLVAPPRKLAFGDVTGQGLPFYGGNLTYHLGLEVTGELAGKPLALRAPCFKAPLLTVELDGRRAGAIAFPPYQLELGQLQPGRHKLDLTCYGCRINAFGAVHCCDPRVVWWGPGAWRTSGDGWTYEQVLRPQGVLSAPRLMVRD